MQESRETDIQKTSLFIKLFKIYRSNIACGVGVYAAWIAWVPRFPVFAYSLAPLAWDRDPCLGTIILKVIFGIFEFYFCVVAVGSFTLSFITFGVIPLSLKNALQKLRNAVDFRLGLNNWIFNYSPIRAYKALQVLVGRFNFAFNGISFNLETALFCCTSICIYGVVRLQTSLFHWIFFIYLSFLALAFDICLLLPMAALNSSSEKLLRHFRGITRGVLRSEVDGCSCLKVSPLGIHSVSRATVLQYVNVVTDYTVFLVCM